MSVNHTWIQVSGHRHNYVRSGEGLGPELGLVIQVLILIEQGMSSFNEESVAFVFLCGIESWMK
jgi:hypothetical protein